MDIIKIHGVNVQKLKRIKNSACFCFLLLFQGFLRQGCGDILFAF